MAVTEAKKQVVADIKAKLTESKGAVLATYRGLTVAQDTELRVSLRQAGVKYQVIKNTMTRIAAEDAGLNEIVPHLEGTTSIAYSADDAVAPAKALNDFIKKYKLDEAGVLQVKVGVVEGKVIDANEVKALAALPSREVLIAKLLGSIQAPVQNTVGVMASVVRSIVTVLDAIREKKQSA